MREYRVSAFAINVCNCPDCPSENRHRRAVAPVLVKTPEAAMILAERLKRQRGMSDVRVEVRETGQWENAITLLVPGPDRVPASASARATQVASRCVLCDGVFDPATEPARSAPDGTCGACELP